MMWNQVPKRLPEFVSGEEFAKLLKATQKQHHKLAFVLAWGSGLRISEVLNVEPRDFDFERGTIKVREGKGKNWAGVTKKGFICGNSVCLMKLAQEMEERENEKQTN